MNILNVLDDRGTGELRKFSRREYQKANVPNHTLARARYESSNRQSLQTNKRWIVLTFPMDPEERTRSRFLPFRERRAINKPRPSLAMSQFSGDVIIFRWIRGREPFLNITQQLGTCWIISAQRYRC